MAGGVPVRTTGTCFALLGKPDSGTRGGKVGFCEFCVNCDCFADVVFCCKTRGFCVGGGVAILLVNKGVMNLLCCKMH